MLLPEKLLFIQITKVPKLGIRGDNSAPTLASDWLNITPGKKRVKLFYYVSNNGLVPITPNEPSQYFSGLPRIRN